MAKLSVGGQAVIEGVMMRGPKDVATAVRDPNGRIQVETHPVSSIADRYPILKKPMLRGTVSLVESLVLGLRSLSYSAKMAGDEDEQLTDKEMAGTIIFALVLASILFIAIPTGAAKFFHFITDDPVFLNLMEGFLRLAIFLAYLGGISRMKDIRRVFQYHGAEHKTIHCYEAGLPLTVANVQRFSRLHPRCGTNFLLIVMLVSIFVYAFLGWPSLIERIVSRILLLPVVAGISYELIRFAGRTTNPVALKLIKPGLWLQYLTTRPPQDDMVEVAIESLKAVLPAEEILPGSGSYLEEAAKADTAAEPPAADHVPALES
ncbi:DUF1385 domain-containing protein [uncultured Selenomonas sp.]|uniref:DUF1385 domain-containing protein n=1 Tax=uncultured Selenomonas sp. TaxID=159275 RepID=UPI002584B731|nr:DUF1385 domain-containing protein [uncultured Selenomonas sp.]